MLTVVLIDDEYFFRNSLKHAICWEELGFQLAGDANNGKSGLELILEKKPDIAIVDINMPVLTGLELIERLSEHDIHCKYILLTGYDEFRYAQKAIRLSVSEYILKPVDFTLLQESLLSLKQEILEEQKKNQHVRSLEEHRNLQMKENFLLDLLNGYFSFNEIQLASYLRELHIQVPFEKYVILLLEFSKISSSRLEEVRTELKELWGQKQVCEIFLTGHSQICAIVETSAQKLSLIQAQGLHKQLTCQQYTCHIGISALHQNAEEIILAYNEANLCLKNAVSRSLSVLQYSQINTSFYRIPEETLSGLKRLIRLKNSEAVDGQLELLYRQFHDRALSYDNVVFCTYELLSCLLSALNEQHAMNCLIDQASGSLLDTIHSFHSLEELQQWLMELFRKQTSTHRNADEDESSVAGRIELYVQEHFSDMELSIDIIAKNLYLNYSYICYCFKRDRGITINDYVSQIRLEKALELFHSGVDNVSYVSEQTGFNNSSYFSKKFKKAFGLSPTEYIKTL